MPTDSEEIHLLAQIGFLAAGRGDACRARRIFEALALLRPESALAFVGLASALLNSGHAVQAVQRLQSVRLPAGPEADMLAAFLGFALQSAGQAAESRAVLRRSMERARHARLPLSPGARLCCRLLGEDPDTVPPCGHAGPSLVATPF